MLEFEEIMVYTGKQIRTSEKTGNQYTLVYYLDETGQTFSTIAECVVPELKQLDQVQVKFKVIPGRYTQLKTIEIQAI